MTSVKWKYLFLDADEPIISGTGKVSKECLDKELEQWNDLLAKWTDTKTRPKQLTTLVRQGIPEALRGEVWQRLTISEKDDELLNNYRILISKVRVHEKRNFGITMLFSFHEN